MAASADGPATSPVPPVTSLTSSPNTPASSLNSNQISNPPTPLSRVQIPYALPKNHAPSQEQTHRLHPLSSTLYPLFSILFAPHLVILPCHALPSPPLNTGCNFLYALRMLCSI